MFGGVVGDFNEGKERHVGEFTIKSVYIDLDPGHFNWYNIEIEEQSERPNPRSRMAAFYDDRSFRLVIFGGWSNKWLGDAYGLNVGKIVGPDYAISSMDPDKGQLSGGTKVNIKGIGFNEIDSFK